VIVFQGVKKKEGRKKERKSHRDIEPIEKGTPGLSRLPPYRSGPNSRIKKCTWREAALREKEKRGLRPGLCYVGEGIEIRKKRGKGDQGELRVRRGG